MASVTQCDVCGNVVKHQESKYIKIFCVASNDIRVESSVIGKELCPECYKKIAKLLNIKE